ncbi:MAG: LptF/LptG family permease [Chlamydiota bacterium]
MKIWHRYLAKRLILTFLFFLLSLFLIYTVVDLSINGIRFLSKGNVFDLISYYLGQFTMYLDLFLPLTFLLASTRVLFDLNCHGELTALYMGGLSKKRLLSPFFLFAAFLATLCYINSQWLAPHLQSSQETFRENCAKKKKKIKRVYSLSLIDESELVYQRFEASKKELFDVFWIRSESDVWHMKYLKVESKPLEGRFVDHLTRNQSLQFEKSESFDTRQMPEIQWNDQAIFHKMTPPANRSISNLFKQAFISSSNRNVIFSYLHYKLAMPLLSLLVIFSISPLCIRFSRNHPVFLITALSLFALLGLKTILEGMLILSENQVLPAYIALWSPLILAFGLSARSFLRL